MRGGLSARAWSAGTALLWNKSCRPPLSTKWGNARHAGRSPPALRRHRRKIPVRRPPVLYDRCAGCCAHWRAYSFGTSRSSKRLASRDPPFAISSRTAATKRSSTAFTKLGTTSGARPMLRPGILALSRRLSTRRSSSHSRSPPEAQTQETQPKARIAEQDIYKGDDRSTWLVTTASLSQCWIWS